MKKSEIEKMPEYFDRYINLVKNVEILEAFDESIEQLDEFNRNKLEKIHGKTYALGKFTVKETFQHVIDWERILSQRTLLFARKEGSVPQAIDENLLALHTKADNRSIDSLFEELKTVRASTRAMFASFDAETLQNTGINWKSEMSVLALGFTIIGHQIHHLKIIEEKYFPLSQ